MDFASVEEAKAVFDKQEEIIVDGHVLYIEYKTLKPGVKSKTKNRSRGGQPLL